jgi:hypothetical protein
MNIRPKGVDESPRRVELSAAEVDMGRLTMGVVAVLRATFGREALPPSPAPGPAQHAGPGRLARLFAPDSLPPPALQPGPEAPRRPGLLALIFTPEPLPPDLPRAPGRPGRWLAWLLAAERLDP